MPSINIIFKHERTDIDLLEMVQRRANVSMLDMWGDDYAERRQKKLCLTTLERL